MHRVRRRKPSSESTPLPARIVATERGPTVACGERFLYSRIDPEGSVRGRVQRLQLQADTLYFIPSPLLGYGIDQLVARLPASAHLLCIEADPALAKLSGDVASSRLPAVLSASPDAVSLLATTDPLAVARAVHELGIGRFRRVRPLYLSGGAQLQRQIYDRMLQTLESELRTHWQNRITLMALARYWASNLLDNLAALPLGADLRQLHIDGPIVVCGAGPSLDDALPWLREHRGRFMLLAVDTAYPSLAGNGLAPDAVFVLESQHLNISDFVSGLARNTPVIADLTSCPAVLRLFDGPRLFYASEYHPVSIFERLADASLLPQRMPPLGSVGVAAVYAALAITDQQVITVGLDFAYPGGRTHARGAPSHVAALSSGCRTAPAAQTQLAAIFARPLLRDRSGSGQPLLTDLVLESYAAQVRRLAQTHGERLVSFRADGLPLSTADGDPAALAAALPQAELAGVAAAFAAAGRASYDPGAVSGFLQDERRLISDALHWLTADIDDGVRHAHLRPLDYLFIHEPEQPRRDAPIDPRLVARVVAHGSRAITRIERALRRL